MEIWSGVNDANGFTDNKVKCYSTCISFKVKAEPRNNITFKIHISSCSDSLGL